MNAGALQNMPTEINLLHSKNAYKVVLFGQIDIKICRRNKLEFKYFFLNKISKLRKKSVNWEMCFLSLFSSWQIKNGNSSGTRTLIHCNSSSTTNKLKKSVFTNNLVLFTNIFAINFYLQFVQLENFIVVLLMIANFIQNLFFAQESTKKE